MAKMKEGNSCAPLLFDRQGERVKDYTYHRKVVREAHKGGGEKAWSAFGRDDKGKGAVLSSSEGSSGKEVKGEPTTVSRKGRGIDLYLPSGLRVGEVSLRGGDITRETNCALRFAARSRKKRGKKKELRASRGKKGGGEVFSQKIVLKKEKVKDVFITTRKRREGGKTLANCLGKVSSVCFEKSQRLKGGGKPFFREKGGGAHVWEEKLF